jgi:hypothetical protein
MSEKTNRPWGFGLLGGKQGTMSLLVFFVILVLSILVHIGGAVSGVLQDRAARPQLSLKFFLRDLREYMQTEKRMPENLKELEKKIWNKDNPNLPTRLQHGNQILVAANYEYIYFSGKVEGVSVANVWAIPLGKYRDEFETVLLVVAFDGESVWRGPALSEEQRAVVLAKGFNPSFSQMSSLNMSKDAATTPAKGKKSGIFK